MGTPATYDVDNNRKLPFEEKRLSVENKTPPSVDLYPVSPTNSADEKTACEYKTHVLWRDIWID